VREERTRTLSPDIPARGDGEDEEESNEQEAERCVSARPHRVASPAETHLSIEFALTRSVLKIIVLTSRPCAVPKPVLSTVANAPPSGVLGAPAT